MKYFNIAVLALLLSACTQFEQKLGVSEHQLTCAPSDSLGCAGWKTKED
jgi:hypothetical protein